jgi:hypothetical protein
MHYEKAPRFRTSKLDMAASAAGWSEPVSGRELHPLKSSAFHGALFELRLLNGMNPPVPEVTVLIHKVTKDRRARKYQLHIKKVLGFKHWDKRRQKPKR